MIGFTTKYNNKWQMANDDNNKQQITTITLSILNNKARA